MNMELRFEDICHRANILYKEWDRGELGKKRVVIYEDHRTILNVISHLKQVDKIKESLNLITFDRHTDFCDYRERDTIIKNILTLLDKTANSKIFQQELSNFVEFVLHYDDDDWIKAGMELNLINDCILFNAHDENSRGYGKEEYQTQKFGIKQFYNIGNVWDTIKDNGILNNSTNTQHDDLWNILGWEYNNKKYKLKTNKQKYIFDIDLDCFTMDIDNETIAIPEKVLINKLEEDSNSSYFPNAYWLMKELIDKAEIITICFESEYCGGIREAHKIFNTIDYLFFDNELGK